MLTLCCGLAAYMCMLAMRRVIRWSENAAYDAARAAPERTRSPSVSTTLASRVREQRPAPRQPTVRRSMRFPPATTTTAAPAAAATRASESIEKRLQRRASGDAAAPAAAEATVLPGHNSLPPPVLHSEYARGSSDDVTASGKIRHHSIDEMVINPHNHHRYRHGSSWHEAHNIPASELKEGPGKEYVSHAHHHKPGEKTAGVSDLARALAAVAEDAGEEPTAAEKHRLTSKLRKDHEHRVEVEKEREAAGGGLHAGYGIATERAREAMSRGDTGRDSGAGVSPPPERRSRGWFGLARGSPAPAPAPESELMELDV